MNTKVKRWINEVSTKLIELHTLYKNNNGVILTEGDLECLFYHFLLNSEMFSKLEQTKQNGGKSTSIHSQITWFKPSEKSGYEVDLCIQSPQKLEIENLNMVIDYPHKDYYYDGETVAIELKFIRHTREISKKYKEDYEKIVEDLYISKQENIRRRNYSVTMDDIAFFIIIGCKSDEIFEKVIDKLVELIKLKPYQNNVYPILFSPSKIEFINKKELDIEKVSFYDLFFKLKDLRLQISKQQIIKAFNIFNDETLKNICNSKPRSLNELRQIRGVTEFFINNYGQRFVDEINNAYNIC